MIDRIIAFSISNKIITSLLVAAMAIAGIYSLTRLSIDAVPDITDNQVQIITTSPDLSAQEVEKLITYPLEIEMGNIDKIVEIRSISRFGLSVITVVFEDDVDIYWARTQINHKVQQAKDQIPEKLGNPELGPITTGLGEIYQYVIYADRGYEEEYDGYDLRTIQDWIIKRQLTGLDGVVEINSLGGYKKQYEISIHHERLKSYNLSLADVFKAVSENNENTGGSYIERRDYTYFIRGEGLVSDIEDLENIAVTLRNGQPILLRNIASVNLGHAQRFGAVTMNGRGEVVAGQVLMLKGANSMEVVRNVKERIEEIKSSLPEGIRIEPYLDRSKLVNNTTRTVLTNLTEGALIVIFILVLLLGNLRAGLIVASVIPLSMLFAVTMMRIFGVSANLMSLGALDFGLIVDGAVIIVESILHHLGKINSSNGLTAAQKEKEIEKSARKIRKSAAFGEIIILIVYIPILFLTGVEGKMFIPMAQTVSFAILGALILSLTYVPMMSALFLKNSIEKPNSISQRIIRTIYKVYRPLLNYALKFRWLVLSITIGVFVLSLLRLSNMGGEFIPTLEEGDFALHQILPTGSSLEKGVEVSSRLQDILMTKFPEIEKIVTKIGTAEIPTDIMPLEAGDIFVILKPKSEWTSASSREEMFELMEVELNKFPGVIYEFTQPIQMRFNELMTGIRQDIAIKIYGEDLGELAQIAHRAETLLQAVTGVGDIQVEPTTGLQQMVVKYNRLQMAKYGLSIGKVNDVIKTSFAGKVAGRLYEGERRFDIVVRLSQEQRNNPESLAQLPIKLDVGGYVPLSEVANILFEEGPAQISRDDTKRRITIGVNARSQDIGTLINDIQSSFEENLELPPGYFVRYGGQFENLQRARETLGIVVPISLILIFLLLYFTFGSPGLALLIFTAIPMSAIGGIWSLYFRDMPFSISAGVGFIALFGVAVLNGIVLISSFNQLKNEGMTDIREIIHQGTRLRLRPVLLTASVASLGFLPMALSETAGAEVQRPLATVVIGGLLTATLLTLFVLPGLYQMYSRGVKTKSRHLLLCLLFIPMALPSLAQSVEGPGLDEIIDNVLTQNHLKYAMEYRVRALLSESKEPLAQLPVSLALRGEEFDFAGVSGVHGLEVGKAFYMPGLKRSYQSKFESEAEWVRLNYQNDKSKILNPIVHLYLDAAYQSSSIELSRELIDKYNEYVQRGLKLYESGESNHLAVDQFQLEIKMHEAKIKNAQDRLVRNLEGLKALTGQPSIAFLPITELQSTLLENSVGNHPQLLEIQHRDILLQSDYSVQEASQAPTIQGGAAIQSVNGNFLFFGYQIGLNVPLGKQYLKQKKEALIANQSALEHDIKWARQVLDTKEAQLNAEIESLLNEVRLIEDELLPSNRSIIESLERAYQYGEANYTELILAEKNDFDLRGRRFELQHKMLLNQFKLKYFLY